MRGGKSELEPPASNCDNCYMSMLPHSQQHGWWVYRFFLSGRYSYTHLSYYFYDMWPICTKDTRNKGVSMVRTSFSADFDLFSIRLRQSLLNTHESPAGRSISSHLCAKRRRQFLVLVWAATFCFCFCLAIAIAFAALAATSIPAQLWALSLRFQF